MQPKSIHADEAILNFADRDSWQQWLTGNHDSSPGAWLRLAKKGADSRSISHAEALEVALCYGWIDAQKKPESARTWLERFTPRSKRSIWSKINCQKATGLIESGRMKPSGLAEVDRAKQDGRWERAYDSPGKAAVPDDFAAALEGNAEAKAFFATLESRNRYALLFRIQTVKKAETRERKIREFLLMLARHEKFHP